MKNSHLLPGHSEPDRAADLLGRTRYVEELPEEEQTPGYLRYWQILRRHKGAVLLAGSLGALLAFLITLPQTPVYQAKASIEIQGLNENFMHLKDYSPAPVNYYPQIDIQTQVKVLESRALLQQVIEKLKLRDKSELANETSRISAWRQALRLGAPQPMSPEEAVRKAAGNVKVKAAFNTRIVEILCDSTNPKLAADFANTLATEFIEQNLESRWQSAQKIGDWLTRQIQEFKIKLEKSEDALQAYAVATGLLFTGEKETKENVAEEKLRQLQGELLKAQADRINRQSRFELASSVPPESLPEIMDDLSLKEYQVKLTELRRQMAELSSSLTPAHYKVQRVQAQISELEGALKKERGAILNRVGNEFESAQRREKLLGADYARQRQLVSSQAGKTIHYNILKREVDTNRQLYESMLQRVKEAGVASAMKATGIRVVDPAVPPERPYKPRLVMNTFLGLLAGMFLGAVLIFARERADRSLQEPGEASLWLNLPELGVIPSAKVERFKRIRARRKDSLSVMGPSENGSETRALTKRGEDPVGLAAWDRKPSLLAESFRATLTSILFSSKNGNRPRVLAVTSVNPGEGKTTVVSNLAIALAEISWPVLLIDADLRRPRIHELFDLDNRSGLTELLHEQDTLEGRPLKTLLSQTKIPGLYVLTSGRISWTASNLLHSPRLPELMKLLRKEFDTIFIDTPPMQHLADARVLGRVADSMILVIRAGRTTRGMALSAKQRLGEDGIPVLGTVLNGWDPKTNGYGYGNKYYEGYYSQQKAAEEGEARPSRG